MSLTGNGGALYVRIGAGSLNACYFVNNTVVASSGNAIGGAVSLLAGGNISDTHFENNIATSSGQSAPLLRVVIRVADHCVLTGFGGAANVQGGSGILSGCQFLSNTASSPNGFGSAFGGAVVLQYGGLLNTSVFADNSASGAAGGILPLNRASVLIGWVQGREVLSTC